MNFSLKPNPLLGHLVPGFTLILLCSMRHWDRLFAFLPGGSAWAGTSILLIAFVAGQFLDAIRNIIENCLERFCERLQINWDFFVFGEKDNLSNLEEYFFTYYVVSANLGAAFFFSFAGRWVLGFSQDWCFLKILAALIFLMDAVLLRKEIKETIDRNFELKKGAANGSG